MQKLQETVLVDGEGNKAKLADVSDVTQRGSIVDHLLRILPATDLEQVQKFHKAFKVDTEDTRVVKDYKYAELRFRLILEEALELAFALGIDSMDIYKIFTEIFGKVKAKDIPVSETEVLDALTDLSFVTNGSIDVFNLADKAYKAMEEVTKSNLSKLIPDNEQADNVVRATKTEMDLKDTPVIMENLNNGYIAVKHRDTGKILKPITYIKPDLEKIIREE